MGFFFVLELKKEIAFAISQTNIKYYDLFFLLSNIAPATVIIEIQLAIDVASPVLAGFLSWVGSLGVSFPVSGSFGVSLSTSLSPITFTVKSWLAVFPSASVTVIVTMTSASFLGVVTLPSNEIIPSGLTLVIVIL